MKCYCLRTISLVVAPWKILDFKHISFASKANIYFKYIIFLQGNYQLIAPQQQLSIAIDTRNENFFPVTFTPRRLLYGYMVVMICSILS